jgi:apolipoprotein D and lipocalin family protein
MNKERPPTVPRVDIARFTGDWYVIAHIPTFIEKDAWSAIERYELRPDATIATTFTFRKGAFDGPLKRHMPVGYVQDPVTRATWGMQLVWPFKAQYLISDLDSAYSQTIITRGARDYAWITARTPRISAADYDRDVALLLSWGDDLR